MNTSFSSEKVHIEIPSSKIKSPGVLYKDKKDAFEVREKHTEIQNLLQSFREQMQSPYTSLPEIVAIPTERSRPPGERRTLLDNFLRQSSITQAVSPGKMKEGSDKIATLTQRTKDILEIYGLELVIDDSKVSKEAYNLLKILTPEICFFPYDFFRNIQINKIVITNDITQLADPSQTVALSVNSLETRKKVRERLFTIIFDRLIVAYPEIIKQWRESEYQDTVISQPELLQELKEVFMSLMHNINHSLIKPKPKKLRQLLANQYPEAMSEERFKNRNKENKKSYRVRFDTETEPDAE